MLADAAEKEKRRKSRGRRTGLGARGLKALVIGMGVLIAIGMGVVVVTVAKRMAGETDPRSASARSAFAVAKPIPKGAKVVDMTAVGDLLAVRLELAGGATRLMLLDPTDRRPPSFIDLVQE
jgi:hypothetical protein